MFRLSHVFQAGCRAPVTADPLAEAAVHFAAGRLEPTEAACEAVLARDPGRVEAIHLLGVVRMRQTRFDAALALLSQVVAARPDDGQAQCNLGITLTALGQPEEAIAPLTRAVAARPGDGAALESLGLALLRAFRPEEAAAACEAAARCAGRNDRLSATLGQALVACGRDADALAAFREVKPPGPGGPEAWAQVHLSAALVTENRVEEALTALDRARALDPEIGDQPARRWLPLMLAGRAREGWAAYEARWDDRGFASAEEAALLRPRWTGAGALHGRRILLRHEQGLGDTIQFVRYAPLVAARGARVVLQVQAGLGALLHDLADTVLEEGDPLPHTDLACPLMSLPLAFGGDIPAPIPYLRPPVDLVARWAARLGPRTGPRVGLAWSGNPLNPRDHARSIPLHRLAPLLALPGVAFHGAQRDLRGHDAAWLAAHGGLTPHGDGLEDFADAAALLAQMDLVVTVDTSIAHLAGAMGRPTLVLLPFAPDFRWGRAGDRTPWYPGLRLLRQARAGDWGPVIAAAADAVRALGGSTP